MDPPTVKKIFNQKNWVTPLPEEPPNEQGTHEMGATPYSHPSNLNIGMLSNQL
jgi:hypothetical protein